MTLKEQEPLDFIIRKGQKMTNYYVEKKGEIILVDEDKEKLQNTLRFMPDLQDFEIQETERPIANFQFADTEEFEQEQAQKERDRLDKLSLSKREVFLALYKAKGITPEQLKAQITDPAVLIEFEYANDYYRGNPLINLIGQQLGFTSDDLDYLFQNKEFPEQPESVEE